MKIEKMVLDAEVVDKDIVTTGFLFKRRKHIITLRFDDERLEAPVVAERQVPLDQYYQYKIGAKVAVEMHYVPEKGRMYFSEQDALWAC